MGWTYRIELLLYWHEIQEICGLKSYNKTYHLIFPTTRPSIEEQRFIQQRQSDPIERSPQSGSPNDQRSTKRQKQSMTCPIIAMNPELLTSLTWFLYLWLDLICLSQSRTLCSSFKWLHLWTKPSFDILPIRKFSQEFCSSNISNSQNRNCKDVEITQLPTFDPWLSFL